MPQSLTVNTEVVQVRLPAPMVEAVDYVAGVCGMSRSAAIRELVTDALFRRDLWPPASVRVRAPVARGIRHE